MEPISLIFKNSILIASLSAWIIAQLIKMIMTLAVDRKFSFERLFGDGGMPSGHSATVMALATSMGISQGLDSPLFALAFLFAAVVMRDACGVRREAGKQATSIKELAEALNTLVHEKDVTIKTEKLKVLVGHTPLQVVMGAILGFGVALFYMLVII